MILKKNLLVPGMAGGMPTAPARRRLLPLSSLQTRILGLFLAMIVIVQLGSLALIDHVGSGAARKSVEEEVAAGARVFDRLREQDAQRLTQGARLMASDYAFRDVIASGDHATIDSALASYGKRIDAPLVMVVDLSRNVLGDSLGGTPGVAFPLPRLLDQAEDNGQAAATVVLRGGLYQVVAVPVLAPLPIAWAVVGQRIDDALALDQQRLTRLDVSFASRDAHNAWTLHASTLGGDDRKALVAALAAQRGAVASIAPGIDPDAVTRTIPLGGTGATRIVALLQQPMDVAMEPFRRLQRQLVLISLLGVAISIGASLVIAHGIARPVRDLANVAVRISHGDYSTPPPASSHIDELRDLGRAFHNMQDDIAARETRIMDLAYRDALTGLPNRAHFNDRVDAAIAEASRTGQTVAVLLMDLDHFKDVNATLGHPIGDLILRAVALRLASVLDDEGEVAARLGGDEFAVLLPGDDAERAQRVARSILRALEAPMMPDGHIVDVRASIGVAVFPDHGGERSTLMRHADMAMYAAKRVNAGVTAWDTRHAEHGKERLSLMSGLRKAVDVDELTLFYQPIVAASNVHELQVETLVRWQHPIRGLVSPGEFIPFAEQTGYIRAITQWVMAHALEQCAAWRSTGLAINVSINISARDLMDAELPDRFAGMLKAAGCQPAWVTLELTESAILDDPDNGLANLRKLHELGCRLAIDDYGTGYSSLAYLRKLPVHELKIDKTFIMGMAHSADDAVIVRSTIDLAHNLGLAVVAEGVEDEATFDRLRALGCDRVQGYLLSRPRVAAEVANWVGNSPWARTIREGAGLRRVV